MKPKGSTELGVYGLTCIGGWTGARQKKKIKLDVSYLFKCWLTDVAWKAVVYCLEAAVLD